MANTNNKLSTFVLVENGKIISPLLTTIREYGRWMQCVFDEYTSNYELYCKKITDGKSVLTYHPGSRIGHYFDVNTFTDSKYTSWYIYQSNTVMTQLVNFRMAEMRDCVAVQVDKDTRINMLRVYSIPQIELYIKDNIDKHFNINEFFHPPKQIVLQRVDMSLLQMPKQTPRKSLLDRVKEKQPQMPIVIEEEQKQPEIVEEASKKKSHKKKEKDTEKVKSVIKKGRPKKLTLSQIEQELGYKIQLIPEKEDN